MDDQKRKEREGEGRRKKTKEPPWTPFFSDLTQLTSHTLAVALQALYKRQECYFFNPLTALMCPWFNTSLPHSTSVTYITGVALTATTTTETKPALHSKWNHHNIVTLFSSPLSRSLAMLHSSCWLRGLHFFLFPSFWDPVCSMPMMHWVKSLGELKSLSIKELFGSEHAAYPFVRNAHIARLLLTLPVSFLSISALKGTSVFSSFLRFCTFADVHLYMRHLIWLW